MDARPLMKYFQPLISWLQNENKNERPGWSEACPTSRSLTNHPVNCQSQSPSRVTLTFTKADHQQSLALKHSMSVVVVSLILILVPILHLDT